MRRAVEGKTVQSLKSGEGLVFEFTGPGRIMTQTRNPGALILHLTEVLPFERA
ncbi:AIM24 family protein [Nonomuraea sp. NPDC049141]|uniref:AIM24 family protein n=1 Tax=Nonomuraea sp. NPDC049141 TaxID=3155500 RepID=UPI0033D2EA69